MRIVIVGAGDVGTDLAEHLGRRRGNELVIVDIDEKVCEHLAAELDALVLHGDGASPEILRKAQLQEADALVAATGSDAINTVVAMLGHNIGVKTIIVKLNEPWLRAACAEIGVTAIVTPKISAAAQMLATLYGFHRLDLSMVVHGGMQFLEIAVKTHAGDKLKDVKLPSGALAVGVQRGPEMLFPRPDLEFQEGDGLLLLAEDDDAADRIRKELG
ncbi:MAG: trk system potassium uptake protein TrkA [Chloroflexi bacterium]|jgi:trk system potassium uptake protein TrkA|nr:MAG: trk system potassium uptake protein TrkA [Chloroflexota bacterium]